MVFHISIGSPSTIKYPEHSSKAIRTLLFTLYISVYLCGTTCHLVVRFNYNNKFISFSCAWYGYPYNLGRHLQFIRKKPRKYKTRSILFKKTKSRAIGNYKSSGSDTYVKNNYLAHGILPVPFYLFCEFSPISFRPVGYFTQWTLSPTLPTVFFFIYLGVTVFLKTFLTTLN